MALAARSRLVGPGVAAFSLAGMLAVSATLVAAAQSTPAQAAPTRPSTAAEDPPNTDYAHKVASLSLHSSWAKSDGSNALSSKAGRTWRRLSVFPR
jgi:hypothetical protein